MLFRTSFQRSSKKLCLFKKIFKYFTNVNKFIMSKIQSAVTFIVSFEVLISLIAC